MFYTSLGSRKAHQSENNPQVSLLFPWHMLERQVMVIGKAGVCRRWKWSNISTAVRATARLAHGSQTVEPDLSRGILESKFLELKQKFQQGEVPLPSFWGGFRVGIEQMEFWRENTVCTIAYTSAIAAPGK